MQSAKEKKKIDSKEIEKLNTLLESKQFSSDDESNEKLKSYLKDLKKILTYSINDYQKLIVAGGPKNEYLQKTTGFYWETLDLYRLMLTTIKNDLTQNKKNMHLTERGELLFKCILNATQDLPHQNKIQSALKYVKAVDNDLKKLDKAHSEKVGSKKSGFSKVRFYRSKPLKLIEEIKNSDSKQKVFYLPYNPHNYVLDHPKTDYADTLGNCYGETMMFMEQISKEKPGIKNICPQASLIDFHLDQSKTIGKSKETLGRFKADPSTKGKEKVTWNNVKELVTKSGPSTKYGDICLIRVEGGRVEGRDKEVGHAIGLIRLNKPEPYKYVLYDYSFGGAMGFSSEDQLSMYFKKAFEGRGSYVAFERCRIQKLGEVNEKCYQFINGDPGIRSIKPDSENIKCQRYFWDTKRISTLIKYQTSNNQSKIKEILSKIASIKDPADRRKLYDVLSKNNKIILNNLSKKEVKHIIESIKDKSIDPHTAVKLQPHNADIILAAYQKDKSILKQLGIKEIESLLKSKKKVEDIANFAKDACIQYPDSALIGAKAIEIDPESIKFLNPSTVYQVVIKNSQQFIKNKTLIEIAHEFYSIKETDDKDILKIQQLYEVFSSLRDLEANEGAKFKKLDLNVKFKVLDESYNKIKSITGKEPENFSPLIIAACQELHNGKEVKISTRQDKKLRKAIRNNSCTMTELNKYYNKYKETHQLDKPGKVSSSGQSIFHHNDKSVTNQSEKKPASRNRFSK